ncbi:MAG TPA: LLM class flavin-dependent oxidoreductase [Paraburkholderia sp.]|jgi:luciferase family oxidoreductase group 1|nr:LLM class flavin-dependent oxidoreductase [Paraburkholderia sp.]
MTAATPFSILDLAPIRAGDSARDALLQTVDMARSAEKLGFARFWLPEHHGVRAFASAATPVLIAHIAAQTATIRIGAGGVMLPNHTPLAVAEQFGTLESLHPGRIDLGVGRASGCDNDEVALALGSTPQTRERFPDDLRALLSFFRATPPEQKVHAIPGAGLDVPVWVLASSTYSAEQAAQLGLPLAFASHIGAAVRDAAIAAYRSGFQPSAVLAQPRVMIATFVTAADTDAQAQRLFTSTQQMTLSRLRGMLQLQLPEPVADFDALANPEERQRVDGAMRAALTGSAASLETQLIELLEQTHADEIMALSFIHDLEARQRSLEIIAQVRDRVHARQRAMV